MNGIYIISEIKKSLFAAVSFRSVFFSDSLFFSGWVGSLSFFLVTRSLLAFSLSLYLILAVSPPKWLDFASKLLVGSVGSHGSLGSHVSDGSHAIFGFHGPFGAHGSLVLWVFWASWAS